MSSPTLAVFAVGPVLITFGVSVFLPWLVALVTAQTAHPGLKAVTLLLLASATGVLTEWQGNPTFDWKIGALGAGEGFLVAVLMHLGLWRPTHFTGSDGGIQRAVPGGIGGSRGDDRRAA